MPEAVDFRVIGIDPGTFSFDLCGLQGDHLFLDASIPTAEVEADPRVLIDMITSAGPAQAIVGPSGYGLPWVEARDLNEDLIQRMYLSLGRGLGAKSIIKDMPRLYAALRESGLPIVFAPGIIHLATVPAHRKVNRIDMGTADKLCAVVLGVYDQARRLGVGYKDASFIYLELGGAFSAMAAVDQGKIVDGLGGTSGPLGYQAMGSMDGEAAYMLGGFSKGVLCSGGAAYIAGRPDLDPVEFAALFETDHRCRLAWEAFMESQEKNIAAMRIAVPAPREILLSGRLCRIPEIRRELTVRLSAIAPVRRVEGFAQTAKESAQGAALIANGLAGGIHRDLVESMELRRAGGDVMDHLFMAGAEAFKKNKTG